ncbi:MAG TPA: DUF2142 domain-containing protein [Solirubrobacteraceae bacterium]|nr:DUF2142 domain-containing protein [Solirubrobacteraceae bacterium]
MNAVCWSIVTPPFQSPDEPDHYAYVKQIAETATLPRSSKDAYETNIELLQVMNGLGYPNVRQQPRHRTISTSAAQKDLERTLTQLRAVPQVKGSFAAGTATAQPPLYYALEAVPYSLASNVLTRLQLMRLLSALMAGVTALFVLLFVRETLPGEPWAWTAGGLAASLTPLLGFVSGSVNPDALLFAVSAALFYLLARGFRRGLTLGLALLIGATVAAGSLTKLNFAGLVPGALLALILMGLRARRASATTPWRSVAVGVAVAVSPIALYAIVNAASGHPIFGIVSSIVGQSHFSLRELSYVWQLFLPHLPGTTNYFPGIFTTQQFWFNGYVGLYGWLDTAFPVWVYNVALVPLVGVALLFARALISSARALRPRLGEGLAYLSMAVGLMIAVGVASYVSFPEQIATFAEARYLLPLLPLFGAILVLAARAAGRRWGPLVGALMIVLFFAHDVFSLLLVAARYYS